MRLNAFCDRYAWVICLIAVITVVVTILAVTNAGSSTQPDPALRGCPDTPDAAAGYDC